MRWFFREPDLLKEVVEAIDDDAVAGAFVELAVADELLACVVGCHHLVDDVVVHVHQAQALTRSEFADFEFYLSAVDVEAAVAQWSNFAVGL